MPPQYQRPLPSKQTILTRYGGWLPAKPEVYEAFFDDLLRTYDPKRPGAHVPAVQEFEDAIISSSKIGLLNLFENAFIQSAPENRIRDFQQLLHCMDKIVVAAPKFQVSRNEQGGITSGEPIGVPLYLLLDLLSNTAAGYDLFRNTRFNDALKALLDSWGKYLQSSKSNNTLSNSDEGWFSKLGLETLDNGRGIFNDIYECPDETAPQSDLPNFFIYNACESTVFHKATGVKEHDQFWLKGQPYSIYDMLATMQNDRVAQSFIGGTVYQAFLSPYDYHRWHSPVNGTIREIQIIPGTYYAALPDEGAEKSDPDFQPGDPRAATRAIIYIDADNEDVGCVVFIGAGMVEVSTCQVTVKVGGGVKVGDELGMFHFGGSTHALIFGPDVKLKFFDYVQPNEHLHVNIPLAAVEI
ncbi:Phophatidylserine decarboxylase-domain-containing protein [Lentinula lateritia]|uniref:Phophatidylserine decarboxylase-domain-containing protein n=1 Tax=Lentinula lateritia TaxID=40482 RepID=A0ABQ8UZK8_9AGAR|nr:Phophatidylserine decarboxylase-domain-containing protein [Lentinula lateritia]